MNQSEIPKLERLRATLTSLIALAEAKTIEADPDGRTMAQLEHDGDLPTPIMDARVQLALLGRIIEQRPAEASNRAVTAKTPVWEGVDYE